MTFDHEIKDGIIDFTFEGDLIGENNGPALLEIVNDAISKEIRYCIIDISGVRYINSSGIGVLITILTKFRNKDGEVILIRPSEQVKKLLIITKLTNIFNIQESKSEALAKLRNLS